MGAQLLAGEVTLFVRTESGVVKVPAGGTLPAGADPKHVAQLKALGLLVEAKPSKPKE